jgi:hypothetical protein
MGGATYETTPKSRIMLKRNEPSIMKNVPQKEDASHVVKLCLE